MRANDLEDAVEGIAGARAGGGLLLGPLVDEGEGDAEFGGDCFGRCFFECFLEHFVRFHDCISN